MKIHLSFATLAILASILFSLSSLEWVIILTMIALVISAELVNSAIEEVCNMLDNKFNLKFGDTALPRNLAAGAVLILAILSVITGFFVFLPKVF